MDRLAFAVTSRNYFNLPAWICRNAGLFAEEGLDVTIMHLEAIDAVNEALRDGLAEFAYGVTEHVILDAESGGRQVIVGGNINRLPFSLISTPEIRSFEDLRGKTIGVSSLNAGSSSLVMKLLAARGLYYPRDYSMIACGPILARWEKLRTGEIQAGLQGAPLNYIALDQGFNTLCEPRDEVPWFQFTSLNADRRWLEANAALALRFLRAFLRGHEWFYADRAGANAIAAQETGVSLAYADRAWAEYTGAGIFPRDGEASVQAVQALIETSSLIRELPERRRKSAEAYIDRRWLTEARQSLVR
ncbi:MAG TPA: ABC transporter substrate-binding protein [Acetobacteraceae bacterium]|nr:ABC transporter substrate-binding protein [Acetobacteraceae bacterium]